tara:strand:+ start:68 stop:679 length:612 start_codon:yes stop_codon:yes gene_type:complete
MSKYITLNDKFSGLEGFECERFDPHDWKFEEYLIKLKKKIKNSKEIIFYKLDTYSDYAKCQYFTKDKSKSKISEKIDDYDDEAGVYSDDFNEYEEIIDNSEINTILLLRFPNIDSEDVIKYFMELLNNYDGNEAVFDNSKNKVWIDHIQEITSGFDNVGISTELIDFIVDDGNQLTGDEPLIRWWWQPFSNQVETEELFIGYK